MDKNKRLYRAPLGDRLMARRSVTPNGCWEYAGGRTFDGYGQITVNGVGRRVHRVSYELYIGPIPSSKLVRHTCDNPACFNPQHLVLGTDKDNVADAIQRGRKALGAACKKSDLTDSDVRAIRSDTRPHRAIGADYGLCHATVGQIKRRKIWAHLP